MPSRADGFYALRTASTVGGRGPTGVSLPAKRFYEQAFIDYEKMMNVPVFPPSPPGSVTPMAVRKAELRILRRRREETGDQLD